jgi:hypothetical protein
MMTPIVPVRSLCLSHAIEHACGFESSVVGSIPFLRSLPIRLQATGKHTRLIIGAVMRKLSVLAYGIIRSGVAFDGNYA